MSARLAPRSLLGQVLLAVAGALIVAQSLAAGLLYHAAQQRREDALVNAAAFQILAPDAADRRGGRAERRRAPPAVTGLDGPAVRLPRGLRRQLTAQDPALPGDRDRAARAEALRAVLAAQGVAAADVRAVERPLARDPLVAAALAQRPLMAERLHDRRAALAVFAVRRAPAGPWEVARVPVPPRDASLLPGLLLQTALLFAALFGLIALVLRRLTRPLAALAQRTRAFAGNADALPPLVPSGPDDVRRLIAAQAAMEQRIGAMLDEKDVMLGAIGHDLKTPLAALRVRIEAVADPEARARMAGGVADIVRTLDDILALARVGRPDSAPERTELSALAAGVVEEFEDLGEPVILAEGARVAAGVRVTWMKRGLRNLVANALRYGGGARVTVLADGAEAVLRVEDDGPGIPEGRITAMLEPFARGESSRNRETGGAGLGLALTRAVAEQHGGRLVIANRPQGGLRAEIRVPRRPAA